MCIDITQDKLHIMNTITLSYEFELNAGVK